MDSKLQLKFSSSEDDDDVAKNQSNIKTGFFKFKLNSSFRFY